ncbi:UNVERIFIED_CONTAM: hypothetical protein HDU68_006423 [Siphonaria sp. JEL0065]|nr:hypothetical protein HDU68_006423 [Siphonaria sp. JEL0065]
MATISQAIPDVLSAIGRSASSVNDTGLQLESNDTQDVEGVYMDAMDAAILKASTIPESDRHRPRDYQRFIFDIAKNCDFPVKQYHGDLRVENWPMETWRTNIQECGCMVMTPAIFETILRNGYIKMKDINLIIFDECHNARKNSTYNQIIALHYTPSLDSDKPIIFGMTASPMSGSISKTTNSIQSSIRQLEIDLCCKAITPDSHSDLQEHIIKPTKTIVTFIPVSQESKVLDKLLSLGITDIPQLKRLVNDAFGILEDFGGWICDVFLKDGIMELDKSLAATRGRREYYFKKRRLEGGNVEGGDESMQVEVIGTISDSDTVAAVENAFPELMKDEENRQGSMEGNLFGNAIRKEFTLSEEELQRSNKFHDFVQLAAASLERQWSSESFEEIEEGEICESTELIPEELRSFSLQNTSSKIPESLYLKMSCHNGGNGGSSGGKRSRGGNDFAMEVKTQRKVVSDFKNGELNLLVATKVAEEGIDIQPCNLVIRFDTVTSVISNIQSRGRARHKNSKYVVMVKENDLETLNRLKALEGNELQMNNFLVDRPSSSISTIDADSLNRHAITLTDADVFEVEATGAKISIFNAVGAIHQYCSLLPHDSFANLNPIFCIGPCLVPRPQGGFHTGWIASLQLPVNAPLDCRFISGRPATSQVDAKRYAALEAVKVLYAAGGFNNHLKVNRAYTGPLGATSDEQTPTTTTAATTTTSEKMSGREGVVHLGGPEVQYLHPYETFIPRIFHPICTPPSSATDINTTPPKYHLVLFQITENGIARVLDIAVILPFRPPDAATNEDQAITVNQVPKFVKLFVSKHAILVDEKRQDSIQLFSNAVFFNGLLRTLPPTSNSENEYLVPIVPVVNGEAALLDIDGENVEGLVDWKTLLAVSLTEWGALKPPVLMEDVKDEEGYRYARKAGSFGLQPKSNITIDFAELFKEVGQELVVEDHAFWDRKYQVLDVLLNSTPFTLPMAGFVSVASYYRHRLRVNIPVFENQPVLLAIPLPHMRQSERAQTSNHTEPLFLIPQFCTPYPLSASIMTESASYMPLLTQSLFHRLCTLEIQQRLSLTTVCTPSLFQSAFTSSGTRFHENYERLEFLGDSYLKMHLSFHLYVTNPSRDEGWLSRSRILLERNRNLVVRSKQFHLPNALLSDPISRKTWAPPMRREKKAVVLVSDKGAADLVESVIGACCVSSGVDGGAKAVKVFYGDMFEQKLSRYLEKISGIVGGSSDHQGFGETHQLLADRLFKKLGYRFKDVRLAVEAVTHTSAIGMYGLSCCFQRLEYLGDSILGYIIAHHLYLLPQKLEPGDLSNMKAELVNNQFLAIASFRLGLPKLLIHANLRGKTAATIGEETILEGFARCAKNRQ